MRRRARRAFSPLSHPRVSYLLLLRRLSMLHRILLKPALVQAHRTWLPAITVMPPKRRSAASKQVGTVDGASAVAPPAAKRAKKAPAAAPAAAAAASPADGPKRGTQYFLMKSEPDVFSVDDLAARPNQTEPWDGAPGGRCLPTACLAQPLHRHGCRHVLQPQEASGIAVPAVAPAVPPAAAAPAKRCGSPRAAAARPLAGVRSHQAKKVLQSMRLGDQAFFYHSNAKPPGVVGIVEVRWALHICAGPPPGPRCRQPYACVRSRCARPSATAQTHLPTHPPTRLISAAQIVDEAHPDPKQFDPKSDYYDASSKCAHRVQRCTAAAGHEACLAPGPCCAAPDSARRLAPTPRPAPHPGLTRRAGSRWAAASCAAWAARYRWTS